MLSVTYKPFMLSVVMLNVVMLSVVEPLLRLSALGSSVVNIAKLFSIVTDTVEK
jgi:hypothetical protein